MRDRHPDDPRLELGDEELPPPFPDDLLDAWRVPTPAPDLAQRVLDHVETAMMTSTEAPTPLAVPSASTPAPARSSRSGIAVVGVAMVAAAALVLGVIQWWRTPTEVSSASVAGPVAVAPSPSSSNASPAVSVERAALVVQTTPPDATVRIDGKPVAGPSPFSVTGLAAGPHRLVIEREGYLPFTRVLEGGTALTLPVELARRDVVLVVSVEPDDATVTLWADEEATTIESERHALRRAEGVRYEIEAEAPGYLPRRIPIGFGGKADVPVSLSLVEDPEHPVTVARREVAETRSRVSVRSRGRSPDLKDPFARPPKTKAKAEGATARTATLRVAGAPGAPGKVYIDGRYRGTTPLLDIKLAPGTHRVEVRFLKGGSYTQRLELSAHETVTVRPKEPATVESEGSASYPQFP